MSGAAAGGLLRSAVIGMGSVGPHHVDAVRRGGYARVVAVAGSDEQRTAAKAAALGVERWTTDAAALVADADIDVIHVCTPNATHVALASAALEAGKHVVVEKPVVTDAAGARMLADLSRRVDRHATVALTYRGYPMVRKARELVARGDLGDMRLVHGGYIQDQLAAAEDYNWRLEPEVSGASRSVADIGTHWFDTAEFVTGLRVEAVLADMATFIPRRRRPSTATGEAFGQTGGHGEWVDVRSEDAATILVRFAGGARGACVVSQGSAGYKNALTLQVAGSVWTMDWAQEDAEHLWVRDRDEARMLTRGPTDSAPADSPGVPALPAGHPEGWSAALRDLLRPFYAAVARSDPVPRTGAPCAYPTLDDGARSLAFVDAALESSAEGRWTELKV